MPAHQLQGELVIPVHTYMQSCPHTHAPGGANIRASSCPKVPGAVIAVASVGPFLPGHCCLGRQRCFSICNSCTKRPFCLFEYFVLPKALTPYFFHRRKLQNYRTHAFLDMGAFACILYHVSTQEIHRQNLKRHRFSPHVLDNL